MQACSLKLHLSPSISLPEFAKLTQGYSGADLQALMYNAHLDAIHVGLTAGQDATVEGEEKKEEEKEIKFVEIGGSEKEGGVGGGVRSKAEQAVVNKRVRLIITSLLASEEKRTNRLLSDSSNKSSRVSRSRNDRTRGTRSCRTDQLRRQNENLFVSRSSLQNLAHESD